MPPKRKADEFDSDDEVPAPGRQILPVANLPLDFDGVPTNGMEYLFTVRRDARRLPHVARTTHNPYEITVSFPTMLCAPEPRTNSTAYPSIPCDEWREMLVRRFKNFRKNLAQPTIHVRADDGRKLMPEIKRRDEWWQFLSGEPEHLWNPPRVPKKPKRQRMIMNDQGRAYPTGAEDAELWRIDTEGEVELVPSAPSLPYEESLLIEPIPATKAPLLEPIRLQPREPTPTLLRLIDERMALHLLMYFAHWMNLNLQSANPSFYAMQGTHARWIFALLARVDDTISGDDISHLRNLARACISMLKVQVAARCDLHVLLAPVSEDHLGEHACWIILSLIVGVWCQRDLWMDMEDALRSSPERVPYESGL
ncbi:hypothetical protein FISHEDRAFT_65391 [Fistulina hepatica ATCC 64428]|nr:hypothetical protein FISHEDRAFT_65391 [Fistulina hepatica ATCC 64428]